MINLLGSIVFVSLQILNQLNGAPGGNILAAKKCNRAAAGYFWSPN